MNIDSHITELVQVLECSRSMVSSISFAGSKIAQVISGGGKVLSAGNGGSAADALHLAEEFVGRFSKERRSLPALCLCADPTLLTCIGNDYGFDRLFSRQIEGVGRSGDVLVLFSSSGNSRNLLLAAEAAKAAGIYIIAVLGKGGGPLAEVVDLPLVVPSDCTARIQEVHTFILHTWLYMVEEACC